METIGTTRRPVQRFLGRALGPWSRTSRKGVWALGGLVLRVSGLGLIGFISCIELIGLIGFRVTSAIWFRGNYIVY